MFNGFFVVGRKNTASLAASSTNYQALGQGFLQTTTTEANAQVPYRTACTLSNLYVRVNTNDRGSSTFTLRKGGVDATNTVTVGASATGEFRDTTNSDSVSAGTLISVKSVIGAGGTSFIHQMVGIQITGTAMVKAASSADAKSVTTDSLTSYGPTICAGRFSFTAAEATNQSAMKTAGTIRYLSVNVSANSRATACTLRSRLNTANGGSSATIGAGVTGQIEDTSGTDAVVSGDLVNLSLTTSTGGGTLTTQGFGAEWLPSAYAAHFQSADLGGTTIAPSATNYYGLGCTTGGVATSPESSMQALRVMTCRVTNLRFYTVANTLSATATIRPRYDAANGNLSLTVGSGATGAFTDDTNMDFVGPASEFNWNINTGVGGTTMELDQISALFTVPVPLAMMGVG